MFAGITAKKKKSRLLVTSQSHIIDIINKRLGCRNVAMIILSYLDVMLPAVEECELHVFIAIIASGYEKRQFDAQTVGVFFTQSEAIQAIIRALIAQKKL